MTSAWIDALFGEPMPIEGGTLLRRGRTPRMPKGLLRDLAVAEALRKEEAGITVARRPAG